MNLVGVPLNQVSTTKSAKTFVWLMLAGQIVMVLILTTFGMLRALTSGAGVAAFVSAAAIMAWQLLGIIFGRSQLSTTIWLAGFTILWIAAVVVSAEYVWLAFVLWLLAGHLLPLSWGVSYSIFVFVVVTIAPVIHHGTTNYANILGPMIGAVFAFVISRGYLQLLRDAQERETLLNNLTKTRNEMAELQDELAISQRHSGAIEERTRISRDIHDTVAQSLSSIRLLIHAERAKSESSKTLEQVESIASEALSDLRRIIEALAPQQLESGSFQVALQQVANRLQEETGISTELRFDDPLPKISLETEIALLRATQSALANVRKHANANKVTITLSATGDFLRLDIADDGQGFDPAAWESSSNTGSYGLQIMRARLRELGGGLEIESTPGDGTSICAFIPKTSHLSSDSSAVGE